VSDHVAIKRGMRVVFKPEWRDKGDEEYTFVAVEDADDHGGFYVSAVELALWIRPRQPAHVKMVESAVPYLPVATLTFLGLTKKGKKKLARVQMQRARGDEILSITEEMISLSTFRDLFQRHAPHTKVGLELLSTVEFSDAPAKDRRGDVMQAMFRESP
jgi:hypothetical protein